MSDPISKREAIAAVYAEHLESYGQPGRSDGDEAYDRAVFDCATALEGLSARETPTLDDILDAIDTNGRGTPNEHDTDYTRGWNDGLDCAIDAVKAKWREFDVLSGTAEGAE